MNISAETSVEFISEDYDSSYDYDFGDPFDFRIKELLIPRNNLQEVCVFNYNKENPIYRRQAKPICHWSQEMIDLGIRSTRKQD